MKIKNITILFMVVFISTAFGLLLVEGFARVVLKKGDYLATKPVADEILGVSIKTKSAGFDEWGFRNEFVPPQADMVAVGDSHTFGNAAKAQDSWPEVLERLSGQEVYNLGMGGYGPNQYYYLLKSKGLSLNPRVVLCGLYMGDDFQNAFSITYGLNYWKDFRKGEWGGVDYDIWHAGSGKKIGITKKIRNWLAKNSIIYQLTFHGPLLRKLRWKLAVNNIMRDNGVTTYLVVKDKGIEEAFLPESMLIRLNQENNAIIEGMRLTMIMLKEMNELCRKNGILFVVVVIPTKESVFAQHFENESIIYKESTIRRVIEHESNARKKLFDYLRQDGIKYIDTLPALRENTENKLYVKTNKDMHPGKNGYSVIAGAVDEYLNEIDFTY